MSAQNLTLFKVLKWHFSDPRMVLTDLIWILFLTTCSVKPSPDNKDDVDHADTMITDDLLPLSMDNSAFVEAETFDELLDGASNAYFPQKRNKRALSSIAKGALASWKLLKDTISLPSTGKRYRNHAKQGNFLTAIKDFFDANPVGVEQTVTSTGVRQYSGRVGDRVLILRSEGRTLSR